MLNMPYNIIPIQFEHTNTKYKLFWKSAFESGLLFWDIYLFFELVIFQCSRPNPDTKMRVSTLESPSLLDKKWKKHCETQAESCFCCFLSSPFLFISEEFIEDNIWDPGQFEPGTRASEPGTRANTCGTVHRTLVFLVYSSAKLNAPLSRHCHVCQNLFPSWPNAGGNSRASVQKWLGPGTHVHDFTMQQRSNGNAMALCKWWLNSRNHKKVP